MAIWLGAWAGDNAGQVGGRQTNRLLVSLTHSDGTFPSGIFQKGPFHGVDWFFNFHVTNLTPGARQAIAIAVDDVGDYVWSVEVAEVDWGEGSLEPWQPGVQLFSAMLLGGGGHQSGVIASAVIDEEVRRIDATQSDSDASGGPSAEWLAWMRARPGRRP